jgi:tRNA (cytidine/uridine-2'-O-)-methyltransferase
MRLALYQPDIPQNTGTILRMCACLGVPVDVIGPSGFDMSDRALRRAGLDYLDHVVIARHVDWAAFLAAAGTARLLLVTSHGTQAYTRFAFHPGDIILMGRESSGAPAHVHAAATARLRIPMQSGLRSLNLAVAAGMVLAEALRQTELFPAEPPT